MRIVLINHSDIQGGAAIAAYRLAEGLKRYCNIEVFFVVAMKYAEKENIFCTRKTRFEYYVETGLDILTNMIGCQYQYFPFSTKFILNKVEELRPDVIYLRNTHGGYFKTSLIKKLAQYAPIVWTLSDMWSFTGHCAHTFGDDSWRHMESGCNDKHIYPGIGIDTGKWLLRQKKNIYQASDLAIVTPSKWLNRLARQSPVFQGKEIVQIYNGFDPNIFRPKNKETCREVLDIPAGADVVMFSADQLTNNPWKGGYELLEILKSIDKKIGHEIHVLIIGYGDIKEVDEFKNLVIKRIGYLESDVLMSTCLSASDIYLYPTRADNLPNVLIEAILCGTPCVTFDIGGCGEIVKDDISGYLIKPFDTEMFSSKIVELLLDKYRLNILSKKTRELAENEFTLEMMSMNYYRYFEKVTNERLP